MERFTWVAPGVLTRVLCCRTASSATLFIPMAGCNGTRTTTRPMSITRSSTTQVLVRPRTSACPSVEFWMLRCRSREFLAITTRASGTLTPSSCKCHVL
ncbi:hypothetical protein PF010_g26670 [Phytophthora fragariae]|uniref:Secreted protein n=1 Tax=Phytophthora fragariae TaxID=53985 RepID=A0A6A3DZS8_9STRA|nr:hypothetical protein PF003_g32269 [Phytophthora fragariae]KAE8924060.1 hypothetical protein PF009_g25706 [Phytophthora fragariae]KAE9069416.1 hypothetical protein PF010_g26670 [Phytophthora fragariae]